MHLMLKNYSLPYRFFFPAGNHSSCSKTQSKNTDPVARDSNIALAVRRIVVGGGGGEEVQVTLKLPVYIKLWYILDWMNEVPHYRCGTSASQICKRVAPGHFYFYYSFNMLYFQFQREVYVPRVSYGIPREYCYCLVLNTCQPVI